MLNSAEIRRDNKKSIYRFMLDGECYTKQQVAAGTGLSVATCNTLLNDMAQQGIVSGSRKQLGEVGRSAVLYQIREDHESYLAVHFTVTPGGRQVESLVFSPTGKMLFRETLDCGFVDYEQVEAVVRQQLQRWPNVRQIIIGTPSSAEYGIIRHCDIPELENVPMKQRLEESFSLPVAMESDLHHKAYGYYKKSGNRENVISLGYFSSHVFPGTATIHKGTIIRGANGIAGMVGFLPCDVSARQQLELLKPETCVPIVAQSLSAIISLLNPGTIVLTGNLIHETMLRQVREKIAANIPEAYIPEMVIADNLNDYYYEGMYQLAVDRKIL